jgi:ribosomal-protein-alanine N-acetyltransferase
MSLFPLNFPVLQTDKLILVEITAAYSNDIYHLFNDHRITQYYPVMYLEKPEDANLVVSMLEKKYEEGFMVRWGIKLHASNELIGIIGFNDIYPGHKAKISYLLSHDYWGRGLMTEAVQAILKYGFEILGLNRIEALVIIGNEQSVKLLLRCGFGYEALLEDFLFTDGCHYDMKLYAKIR